MFRIDRYDACSAFMPSAPFKMPLALAAALRRRLADARLTSPFCSSRSSVVCTALTETPRPLRFSISAKRSRRRRRPESQQRQHDDLLEFAEHRRRSARHGALISTMWINLSKC